MKGTGDEEEKKRQNIFIHFLETKIPGGRERKNKTKEKEKIVFIFDSYSRKVHVVLCVCVCSRNLLKKVSQLMPRDNEQKRMEEKNPGRPYQQDSIS